MRAPSLEKHDHIKVATGAGRSPVSASVSRSFNAPSSAASAFCPPVLELVERHAELARKILGGLAPQQAKHHLTLAVHAPALARRPAPLAARSAAAPSCGQRGRAPPAKAIRVITFV
jgi:hypothetical protein